MTARFFGQYLVEQGRITPAQLEEAVAHLASVDVPVIEGPVPRPAADGTLGQSVYFRDPDGNLVEFLTTD